METVFQKVVSLWPTVCVKLLLSLGGIKPMFKNFVANILLFYRAFWQHKIDMKYFLRAKISQIEGKIV